MKIRLEEKADYREVEELVRNAFWNIYRPGAFEHFIVHNLRNDDCRIQKLTYVIEKDDLIIGSINYSMGKIFFENDVEDAVVLGPVAIDGNCQGQGLGTELIGYTLDLADRCAIPLIFVIGDENYYSRFGFESASKYNLYLEGTSLDDENPFFMVRIFDDASLDGNLGIFHNPDVFDVDESDVDEFDKDFEYREKLILDGQLVFE